MVEFGYGLAGEEFGPRDLVRHAARAEEAGFGFVVVSDHFHPWNDLQGESPFVWSVLGGIAEATERIRVGTGVTCPTVRTHPAIVAQAAATTAAMLPGRFFLGVGTGENLNEHVLGDPWPAGGERLAMLEEALELMRLLWRGDMVSVRGARYTVEAARIYTLPEEPFPVYIAAGKPQAAALAGRVADGLIDTSPAADNVARFESAGGQGKPKLAQVKLCWHESEEKAKALAHELWPNAALPGDLGYELPLPSHFEQAAELVDEDAVAEVIPCGPDPERHVAAIDRYVEAGFDHVYVQQIGPDQDGFCRFFEREIRPRYEARSEAA